MSKWRDLRTLGGSFWRLAGATLLSGLADTGYFILLSWLVIEATGSGAAVGIVLTCASVPRLCWMLIGGVVADRWNKRRVLLASLWTRAGALAGMAVVLSLTAPSHAVWAAAVIALVFGTVDAFYWPVSGSILPFVVTRDSVPLANAALQTLSQVSVVCGPLLASALLLLPGHALRFAVISVTYALSGGLVMRVSMKRQHEGQVPSPEPSRHGPLAQTLRDLAAGFRYVRTEAILLVLMVASLVMNFLVMGPINVGLPLSVKLRGWSGSMYGVLEAAFGVGGIAGGLLTMALNNFRGRMRWLSPVCSLLGVALALAGTWPSVAGSFAAMVVAGIGGVLVNIPFMSYIQSITRSDMLGRVMSLLMLASQGLVPISYACTSAVLGLGIQPYPLMWGAGALIVICALSLLLVPAFRTMEQHPAWQRTLTPSSEDRVSV